MTVRKNSAAKQRCALCLGCSICKVHVASLSFQLSNQAETCQNRFLEISDAQYGFRPRGGTMEVMFVVRRVVDCARLSNDVEFHLIALDWAKAFDSISPLRLLEALTRFGIPLQIIDMIKVFQVKVF